MSPILVMHYYYHYYYHSATLGQQNMENILGYNVGCGLTKIKVKCQLSNRMHLNIHGDRKNYYPVDRKLSSGVSQKLAWTMLVF